MARTRWISGPSPSQTTPPPPPPQPTPQQPRRRSERQKNMWRTKQSTGVIDLTGVEEQPAVNTRSQAYRPVPKRKRAELDVEDVEEVEKAVDVGTEAPGEATEIDEEEAARVVSEDTDVEEDDDVASEPTEVDEAEDNETASDETDATPSINPPHPVGRSKAAIRRQDKGQRTGKAVLEEPETETEEALTGHTSTTSANPSGSQSNVRPIPILKTRRSGLRRRVKSKAHTAMPRFFRAEHHMKYLQMQNMRIAISRMFRISVGVCFVSFVGLFCYLF